MAKKSAKLATGLWWKRGIAYCRVMNLETGEVVKKSTGCKDPSAAQAAYVGLQRKMAVHGADVARDATLSGAVRAWTTEIEAATMAVPKKMSLATLDFYRHKAAQLLSFLEKDESLLLSNLRPPNGAAVVDGYVNARRGSGVSDHTISKELGTLRSVLRHAKRHGRFIGDIDAVLPSGFSPEYVPVERWLTPVELRSLLLQLGTETAARAAFMVATSAEWGATERAERDDVEIVDGSPVSVHVRGTKRGSRDRRVPLVAEWQVKLVRLVLASESTGRLFLAGHNVRRGLLAACKRAGIPPCSPNDLRRTFAVWMRAAGMRPSEISVMMGHADSRMVERVYGRLTPELLRGVMEGRNALGAMTDIWRDAP